MDKEIINTNENLDEIMNMSKEEINNLFNDNSLKELEDLLKFTYGGLINNE